MIKKRILFDLENPGDNVVVEMFDDGGVALATKEAGVTTYVTLDDEQRLALVSFLNVPKRLHTKWRDE